MCIIKIVIIVYESQVELWSLETLEDFQPGWKLTDKMVQKIRTINRQ